jgi:hypothetical protein
MYQTNQPCLLIGYASSNFADPLFLMRSFNSLTSLVLHRFAETYVKEYTQTKYRLVKAITLLVRNTVEDVKFTCTMMGYFVHVVVCS